MDIHKTRRLVIQTMIITGVVFLAMAGTGMAVERFSDLPAQPQDPEEFRAWLELIPHSTGSATSTGNVGVRAQTYYTVRTVFDAAVGLVVTEDFEEGNVAAGGVETCTDPYDSTTSGLCWSPGDIEEGISIGSSSGAGVVILGAGFFGGATTIVTGANTFSDYTYVDFNPAVNAIGFDLLPAGSMTIRLYDAAGALLDTVFASGSNDGLFWGVTSDETINRIEIEGEADSGEIIDNLTFGGLVPVELQSFEIE